ncbi:MAG TPA: hypothetical protein VLD62_01260 [Acidimicrobiia bacterium]|nr:hypothetical protein [Acidimicrobiia bacterium]
MRRAAPEWVSTIKAFVDAPASIAVAGEDAGAVARELGLGFGLALTTEEIGFALLGLDHPEANRVRELPSASVDVVVFRRPWNGPVESARAFDAASRVLASGGRVFAGERELDRLTKTSVIAYPIRAFVDADPTVVEEDLHASVGRLGLAAGMVRAGFKRGQTVDVDERRGTYPDPESFVASFVDEDPAGVVDRLRGAYRDRPVHDVDPWVYATGVKP